MDSAYGCIYEHLYRRHWWFRARERILVSVLRRLALPRPAEILDVGCGNGLFFDELAHFGDVRGIEVDQSLVPQDSQHGDRIYRKPLGDPQYVAMQFDLITALDVIEHIENDGQAVTDMIAMLRPGGKLVITVPASMLLWDRHDVINMHYRRYTSASLRRLLSGRGRVLELRYLFHALFLPKYVIRTLNRFFDRKAIQHGMPAAPVNRLMETACLFEYFALNRIRVPFGTSLLAIVEKPAPGYGGDKHPC